MVPPCPDWSLPICATDSRPLYEAIESVPVCTNSARRLDVFGRLAGSRRRREQQAEKSASQGTSQIADIIVDSNDPADVPFLRSALMHPRLGRRLTRVTIPPLLNRFAKYAVDQRSGNPGEGRDDCDARRGGVIS